MTNLIYAYTPPASPYPPYVNLSEVDGEYRLMVRNTIPTVTARGYADAGLTASMTIPREQLKALRDRLMEMEL